MRLVAVVLCVSVFACSKSKPATTPAPAKEPPPVAEAEPPPPPPPPPMTDAEFTAMMDRAVRMFEDMGRATDAGDGDCAKIGAGLDRVLDDYQDFITVSHRFKDDEQLQKRAEEWMKDHMDAVMGPMMKVGTAGQKCASDPAFQAFQKRFEGEM